MNTTTNATASTDQTRIQSAVKAGIGVIDLDHQLDSLGANDIIVTKKHGEEDFDQNCDRKIADLDKLEASIPGRRQKIEDKKATVADLRAKRAAAAKAYETEYGFSVDSLSA